MRSNELGERLTPPLSADSFAQISRRDPPTPDDLRRVQDFERQLDRDREHDRLRDLRAAQRTPEARAATALEQIAQDVHAIRLKLCGPV